LICPQCGFEQPEAAECARCGAVPASGPAPGAAAAAVPLPAGPPTPAYGNGVVGVGAIYDIPRAAAAPSALAGRLKRGETLASTFSIYFANFLPFLVVSFVALLPRVSLAALTTSEMMPGRTAHLSPAATGTACLLTIAGLLAQTLGSQVATGAVAYGVLQHLRGADTSVGESLRVGLQAMGRVLGVAVLSGLGIGLGLMVCFVPGILLAVQWAVAVPVALEESPGARASLSRSTALTEGNRWAVFGILGILWILNFAFVLVLSLALRDVASSRPELGSAAAQVLTTGLSGTAAAVIYYRLRSLKESIDVRQLASVFD
jgi:hypothetical protein